MLVECRLAGSIFTQTLAYFTPEQMCFKLIIIRANLSPISAFGGKYTDNVPSDLTVYNERGRFETENVPSEMAEIRHFPDGSGPQRKALGAHGRDRTGKGETPEGLSPLHSDIPY